LLGHPRRWIHKLRAVSPIWMGDTTINKMTGILFILNLLYVHAGNKEALTIQLYFFVVATFFDFVVFARDGQHQKTSYICWLLRNRVNHKPIYFEISIANKNDGSY
jgi:hypothetical protein